MHLAISSRLTKRRNPMTLLALIGSCLVLACAPASESLAASPAGVWELLHDGGPAPQFPSARRATGYAYDSIRHRLIVFGGFPTFLNDVWALDLESAEWERITPAGTPPSPRYGPTAIHDVANDRLIVFGGFDGFAERNDCWALSLSGTPAWTQLAPAGTPPPRRSFHVACYDAPRQRMLIFGGYDGSFLNDTWELSLGGLPQWTPLTPAGPAPPGRNLAGVAYDSARERMLVFGGWSGTYRSDTWALSLAGAPAWDPISTPSVPPGRREISMAYDADDDRIVLFGGNNGSYLMDSWSLPLGGFPDWQPLPVGGEIPARRYGHATVYDPLADRMVVFGGAVASGHLADSWSLDLDGSAHWERLIPGRVRSARNYSAVLDPVAREMIVFGGETTLGLTNGMMSYSLGSQPVTRRMVLSTTLPPSPRYAHRAVWDPARDRMLVFGGYTAAEGFVNELWEFRPRPVPAWTPLLPAGAPPSPRFAGGLVLDAVRDRLIAFGGYNTAASGFVPMAWNDVWALPLSGAGAMTWQELSPAGTPPAPRWGTAMAVDPARNRAVVFGGASATYSLFADAHVLDLTPAATAWTNLAPTGTPPDARTIHAGVLDPVHDRFVIFGGFDNLGFRNDVHALHLAGATQWTALAPQGGPPAVRDAITAVYDGAAMRMVVFGGWGGSYLPDTWALAWDVAVPVLVSLVSTHAEPGRVSLNWRVSEAASAEGYVERREGSNGWRPIGVAQRESERNFVFVDREVKAAERYFYRLRLRSGGDETISETSEVWVPSGYSLELAGAQPNPATEEALRVGFSLPRRMKARLDLLDLAGRRVASLEVGSRGAGRHVVPIAGGHALAPGLYLLRLESEDGIRVRRALIVR